MYRVGSWLYGRKSENASTHSLHAPSQAQDLSHAMKVATLILDDDVDGAEEGLSKGDSTFHKLGKGVVGFLRATLGFEQDIMRQASERLYDAESSASVDQRRATHNSNANSAFHSAIYDPGTEYALCQAMAEIMGAVVGVLNESLTEAIRGFYKMRKAYMTLDNILKMEERYLQKRQTERSKEASLSHLSVESQSAPEKSASSSTSSLSRTAEKSDEELARDISQLQVSEADLAAPSSSGRSNLVLSEIYNQDPDSEEFSCTIDAFIHSGANLCFGILLLILSMIPPTFGRLLAIIGFRGDKERGLRMLWQASAYNNLIGAIAAEGILGYYNGFVRYCDIVPDAQTEDELEVEGYPAERLATLLKKMRARYPRSQLWLLEEARMEGANRNLAAALTLMKSGEKSPLKQVEALRTFELSMTAMYLHRYEECANFFLQCVELNSWSPSLYYYIAGSAHLVLYRRTITSDPAAAAEHKKKANEYLKKAPTMAGKKRFMARQLPFDVFVCRKISKWEARAKEWKVDLVDAAGVDPIEEMIFFWNGHNRMTREELDESLHNLAWSESSANPNWHRETEDEKAALQLLRAAILRAQRHHRQAKEILTTHVLTLDRQAYKGSLRENWIVPVGHYEMAANLWMERPTYRAAHDDEDDNTALTPVISRTSRSVSDHDAQEVERDLVLECEQHLEKVARWEAYELDTRIGLKVTAAKEAVRKWKAARSA